MSQIKENTSRFASVAARTIFDLFGVRANSIDQVREMQSLDTKKSFLVSLYFTGTVYGEYVLALDESTAAKMVGWEETITDQNRTEARAVICDALSETLNMIVGEAIVTLQQDYAKLTLTAPRVIFGDVVYPQFKTGHTTLQTDAGEIECHFCLDLMRLDLATSYGEAMESLVEVNEKLKDANRHLAEQQAQLVHTEKMASIGMLASGVAHEINNPLFFVDANLNTLTDYVGIIESTLGIYDQLCRSLQGDDGRWVTELELIRSESEEQDLDFVLDDTKQLMSETREGVQRIKSIVQGLRDFSQVDRGGFSQANLNTIAETTCELLSGQLNDGCRVKTDFAEMPAVICNAGEIGQVISGIVLNASQAIDGEGCISIRTQSDGDDVVLIVEDDGCGIPVEHLERLTEPFFTTKSDGGRSGLGLSIAYGIIQKHQGSLQFQNRDPRGTRVSIRLPLAERGGRVLTGG